MKSSVTVIGVWCAIFCMSVIASFAQPVITATGDQYYCPQSQIPIVTSFNITDTNSTEVEALHIQISTGYVMGTDVLNLTGSHPNIIDTWSVTEGRLSLSGIGGSNVSYTDLIAAVYDVVYQSYNEDASGEKYFSFTFGEGYFLPATGHHYLYVAHPGIRWDEALDAATTYNYLGAQGYLATITVPEEAQLTGTQVTGTGWIGGSDEETEGEWKWVSGPEAGTVFWNGDIDGSTPNYANWNENEPNNCCGGEDYAHITKQGIGIDGSWNDLDITGDLDPTSDYHPQGYVVEFGGMPGDPDLTDVSASTMIKIPEIQNTFNAERCDVGSVTLAALASEGDVLWFESEMGGIPIAIGNNFTTPVLNMSTTYYTMASLNGCLRGKREPVLATIHQLPGFEPGFIFINCDVDGVVDGFTDFNLTEADDLITTESPATVSITYHLSFADADSNINALDPIGFNNSMAAIVFARIVDGFGCYSVAPMQLQVSTTSFPTNFMVELEDCDDDTVYDGFATFNLDEVTQDFLDQFPSGQYLRVYYYRTYEDALLEQNEIVDEYNYMNETAFSQTLYVRVESLLNGECFGIGPHLELTVNLKPEFELDTSVLYCLNEPPVTLETYNASGDFTYVWTNEAGEIIGNQPFIEVSEGGMYTVIAYNTDGCDSLPKTINVEASEIANISNEAISIVEFSDNNSISIDISNLGIGDYEFSLNDNLGPYQDEPYFDPVSAGIHTLYIRDKNNCGVVEFVIFVSGFPKFFTPNNDGYNDTWNLKGFNNNYLQNSLISIYDRYGKLIKQISPSSDGWNGTFNGEKLSASDYWFVAELVSFDGLIQTFRGHFSLVR